MIQTLSGRWINLTHAISISEYVDCFTFQFSTGEMVVWKTALSDETINSIQKWLQEKELK